MVEAGGERQMHRGHGAGDRLARAWLLDVAVFLPALVLRLVYLRESAAAPTFAAPIIDAGAYHDIATALAQGHHLKSDLFWQPALYPLLLAAIYAARHEIVLTTPYFVPGEALLTALRSAAVRGVRVVLIVPEKIDSRLVRLASEAYHDDLLSVGVVILRFRDGLLHTKSMVVDEEITVFGTVNLDLRSFELNFEVSLIAYDHAFSAAVRALQRVYESRSRKLDLDAWRARPRARRLLENAVQTMSPLL
jgi:phosphatidylserine/phosphatidylglycerophosphate/cardiolipin synthase-like enzyme